MPSKFLLFLLNGLTRLLGNIAKIIGYFFHTLFPKVRFTIPAYSPAKIQSRRTQTIPKKIWQTNYTDRVTLPVYINYLFNRLMSLDYEYHHACDEDRLKLIEKYGTTRQYEAFLKLTDGASQADFWRLFVLNLQGGVYLDIDAQLVCPLSWIIKPQDNEVILLRRPKEYTNYFIASIPKHWILIQAIEKIIENIQARRIEGGVYSLTGPVVLNDVIGKKEINSRVAKITCSQGTFTNEHFQYMEKKGSKWIYKKNEDLLK